MSFNFGTSTPKTAATATGFTLPTNPITTAASGFTIGSGGGDINNQNKFGGGGLFATSTPALSFGAEQPKTTFVSPSISTTTTTTSVTSAPLFNFGNKPSTTSSTPSFTPILGSTAASTTSATSISAATSTPTVNFGLTPSSAITTTSAPAINFGLAPTAATSAPTTALTAATQSSTSLAVALTTSSATATTAPANQMSFAQLDDSINKWTIDLEEHSKFFINQSKQLNAWDCLLISNSDKILALNGNIEKVKQQQHQLDQELDFVLAQQKELEDLIKPLEKDLLDAPVTDIDRNQMYQYSEIIDSQLKQMADDLKEVIEHVNESNKNEDEANPIAQIGHILSAHMNSLQWIDMNTSQLAAHLEQIKKMQDPKLYKLALGKSFNDSFQM